MANEQAETNHDRRPFIAVVIIASAAKIRKFRPAANDSWDVWNWAGGWAYFDNVGDETAKDWRENSDEVFFEEPK